MTFLTYQLLSTALGVVVAVLEELEEVVFDLITEKLILMLSKPITLLQPMQVVMEILATHMPEELQ